MNKAFVDTTILTDVLLKTGEAKENAEMALNKFTLTLLPVYAIKEFKAGPLKNFVWFHNKLYIVKSFEKAVDALQKISRTPQRYLTSTAIQSLKEATGSISKETPASLEKKYGENALLDKILCDEIRLAIKVSIYKAWQKRRKMTSEVVLPLPCYREVAPYEKRGLIELIPKNCNLSVECVVVELMKKKPEDLRKLRDVIKDSDKTENKRRAKILRQIYRTPKMPINDRDCKYLGDAVFAFFAPADSMILSTNIKDHLPLAKALRKKAISPKELHGT